MIQLDWTRKNNTKARKYENTKVEELVQSIEEIGLQFPVVVQPTEEIDGFKQEGFRWRLIAGHRRFRAVTTFLKWTEIPDIDALLDELAASDIE